MQIRAILAVTLACTFTGLTQAENLDLTSHPDTVTVGLSPYSLGFGIGALGAVNHDLSDRSNMFLKLAIAQTIRFQEHWDVGMDLEWWLPGINLGGTMNLDYIFGTGSFKPFVGLGVGMQYIDGYNRFGEGFGIEGTGHLGMYLDVLDNMQLRIRAPLQMVANKNFDHAAGLDIALLFSSPQRNTRVKKLKY